jgi:AcrR family transcriptional regulator
MIQLKTARRSRKSDRWERRYRQALDAAATTFAEKGYEGASTSDIARRLGVRQASLYYYFPSKEAALAAVCEAGVRDFIANVRDIVGREISISEKIRAAITSHLAPLGTYPNAEYSCVFVRHRHRLAKMSCRKVSTLTCQYQRLVERLFVDSIASGELPSHFNSQRAAKALLALCNSIIAAGELPRKSSIDNLINDYARIFTYGVLAP